MATPIQHTSQYIPTNLQAMSAPLERMQSEYDAGFAAPLMFEDQFSQIEVSPENMAGKQAVLGNFQDKIKGIVDQYGGDYGAASRDIARAIAKERQNPFYQLAPQHSQAIKRQQALLDKYGANAFQTQNVPRQFVNEKGEVQDVNLDPRVLNQMDLERKLATEFNKQASQTRQGELYSGDTPGLLHRETTRGITQDEVGDVSNQMLQSLYNMDPDLAAAIDAGDPRAMQIAQNMAQQMVQGSTISDIKDPNYSPGDPGGITGGMPPLTVTSSLGVKSNDAPKELTSTKRAMNINDSSNPMAQAWKNSFDESFIKSETIEKEGLSEVMKVNNIDRKIISKKPDGSIDSKQTLSNINSAVEATDVTNIKYNMNSLMSTANVWYDDGEKSYNRGKVEKMSPEELAEKGIPEDWEIRYDGYYDSNTLLIPSAKKEAMVKGKLEEISNAKKLGRFKDYYELSLGNALESENSDLGVNFYDFDLAGTSSDLDPRMKNLYGDLQVQFDRMNADDFTFLTSPEDANVLVDGKEKKQDKYKREHGLRSKGSLQVVGIGSTANTGVVFRVEDKNGEEYTVRPKNPSVTANLTSHYGGGGQNDIFNQFRMAEDDFTIKNKFNSNYDQMKDNYSNYREYITKEAASKYEALRIIQSLKSRGISLDDKIQLLK